MRRQVAVGHADGLSCPLTPYDRHGVTAASMAVSAGNGPRAGKADDSGRWDEKYAHYEFVFALKDANLLEPIW